MIDGENRFSNRQSVTGTAVSDNIVQLDPSGKDVASGEPLFLNVIVNKPSGSASAMTVAFQVAATETMTSPVTVASWVIPATVMEKGGPVLSASLPAKLSRGYGRIQYSGTSVSGLQVTAFLGQQGQTNLYWQD